MEWKNFYTGGRIDLDYTSDMEIRVTTVEETDGADYRACHAALLAAGYEKYTENEIVGNLFATFTKGDEVLHTAFYPTLSLARLITEPRGYLPPLTAPIYEKKKSPSITQFGAEDCYGDIGELHIEEREDGKKIRYYDGDMRFCTGSGAAFGMSYVLQLEDGSFVIVDGGCHVPANECYEGNDKDLDALLEFLKTNNEGTGYEKPRVTWLVTHSHPDHMSLPNRFLVVYHDEIQVELVGFSFPNFDDPQLMLGKESVQIAGDRVKRFRNHIRENYPHAKFFSFHAGQRLFLPGCELEFLQTHEDYRHRDKTEDGNPYVFHWLNFTSPMWKMKFGDRTVLFMGDGEFAVADQLMDVYGNYLKSDVLQVIHHGYSGGLERFSRIFTENEGITYCMWPTDGTRFFDERRCGEHPDTYFNYILRTAPNCRHFHAGHRVTVKLDDMTVSAKGDPLICDDLGQDL